MDYIVVIVLFFVFVKGLRKQNIPVLRNPDFNHEENVFRKYFDYLLNEIKDL